eukprot:9275726-Heterocapsa_arctica.AAC.1
MFANTRSSTVRKRHWFARRRSAMLVNELFANEAGALGNRGGYRGMSVTDGWVTTVFAFTLRAAFHECRPRV